jgi:hypothetical protein
MGILAGGPKWQAVLNICSCANGGPIGKEKLVVLAAGRVPGKLKVVVPTNLQQVCEAMLGQIGRKSRSL